MIYPLLRSIENRLFFSVEDVAELLGINPSSAHVLCSRYVQKGLLIRLKRNFYVLAERWRNLGRDDFLVLANFLQVPSYISFLSALFYYEITTQVPRMAWESASLKRSKLLSVQGVEFRYYKIARHLYLGFQKEDGFFIAEREKAFLDSIYLSSFGRYSLDIPALDLGKLEKEGLEGWLRYYPESTKRLVSEICGTL
jgi:predicted transcriptional regulator of viral defense system